MSITVRLDKKQKGLRKLGEVLAGFQGSVKYSKD
jgi:hypothetical protein